MRHTSQQQVVRGRDASSHVGASRYALSQKIARLSYNFWVFLVSKKPLWMCFQVYGLSNIDLLRCMCVCLLCRALSLILFLFTFPEFCLLNFLQLSLEMTQLLYYQNQDFFYILS